MARMPKEDVRELHTDATSSGVEDATDKKVASMPLRVALTVAGALCIGCGIALAKHSSMGTSPISCLPAVCSEIAEAHGIPWLTLGAFTFALNALCLLGEIILLRHDFHPFQLLQIPLFVMMAASVDLWMALVRQIPLPTYFHQALCLAASIAVLSFGINMQMYANVLMTPGDAISRVISYVSGKPFNVCKVTFDTTLMCSAALISLVVLDGLYDVREGSIIAALCVGNCVKLWGRALLPITRRLPDPLEAPRGIIKPLIPQKQR